MHRGSLRNAVLETELLLGCGEVFGGHPKMEGRTGEAGAVREAWPQLAFRGAES